MPQKLAADLVSLRPRIVGNDVSDAWFQLWQFTVGATYSLARAAMFLPGHDPDLTADTERLAQQLALSEPIDESRCNTWMLGYFLNSAEFRIQSTFHRLLRAFSGKKGHVRDLAKQVRVDLAVLGAGARVLEILDGFLDPKPGSQTPGGCLAIIHERVNELKHDPVHDLSDRLAFRNRWKDARAAIGDLIILIDSVGVLHGSVLAG
jgi:hypothetical protein